MKHNITINSNIKQIFIKEILIKIFTFMNKINQQCEIAKQLSIPKDIQNIIIDHLKHSAPTWDDNDIIDMLKVNKDGITAKQIYINFYDNYDFDRFLLGNINRHLYLLLHNQKIKRGELRSPWSPLWYPLK